MMIGFRTMAKIVVAVFMLALSFSNYAKVVQFDKGNLTVFDFEIDDVLVKTVTLEGQDYFKASFEGVKNYEGILYKKGHAELPVIRFYVDADSTDAVSVVFPKGSETRASLEKEIYPAQESLAKIEGVKLQFSKDTSFYKSDSFWPGKDYTVEEVSPVNGKKRVQVTVFPMQYNPAKNRYRLRTNFVVQVENAPLVYKRGQDSTPLFVMVAAQQFKNSPSLEKYAAFKQKLGFRVETIFVGEDVTTDDDIRAALQARLGDGLAYAMLVGDNDEVPSHETSIISGVTDHYYRAIDTNDYSSDINGPDIGLGRITPKNEQELQDTIDKFIRYQVGEFSHEEWLNYPAFIGTDDKYQVAEGSHNYAIDNYTAPLGYLGFFPQANLPGGDQLYAITHNASDEEVVSHVKDGRFLVNYSGHGARTYWAGPHFTQENVRSLDDLEVLPFVISNACITGDFRTDESFGETWIKHPAGAIMFWGSMDSSYWDEDDIMEKRMYDGIFEQGNRTFSSITQYALLELWRHYGGEGRMKYYMETYVVFGDPSIELRTGHTELPEFSGADVLPIGIPSLTYVLGKADGSVYKNVRVSLINEEGALLSTGVTNEYGEVVLTTEGAQVGETLNVVAYGGNIRMTPKEVLVVSPDSPYLVSKAVAINGEVVNQVSPYEEIVVGLELENVSDIALEGATLELVEVEGEAEILSSSITVPALDGHQVYTYDGNDLVARVGNAANGSKVVLHFRWTTTDGEVGEFTRKLTVARGNLEITSVDFGNPEDAMVGGMGPGDAGSIYVTVTNTGLAPIKEARLDIVPGTCMASVAGDLAVDYLAAGETLRIEYPIDVTVAANCANDELVHFSVDGTYQDEVAVLGLEGAANFVIGRLGRAVFEQGNLDLPILDKETTEYTFEVPGIDKIKDISVHIQITHTYQGDIEIYLTHPNGTRIKLRKRSGGGTDNIDEVYGLGGTTIENLSDILSLNSDGVWKLEVSDLAASDQGTLDYVKAEIIGYLP